MTWLQEKQVVQLIEHSNNLTIGTAKIGIPMAVLKKEDATGIYKAVSNAIKWLQDSLNIKTPMNDYQISDAAITIVNKYYWLRLEEIVMVLSWIKTGKTGKLYHAFDVQVFCVIIEDYLKSEDLAIFHEKESKKLKEEELKNIPTRQRMKEIYERLQLGDPDKPEDVKREVPKTHETFIDKLKKILPRMNEQELNWWREEAVNSNYKEPIILIDQEFEKRKYA